MLNIPLDHQASSPFRILCLGAHSDDIEIGCGATILQLLSARTPVDVTWVVFSGNDRRQKEAHASADLFLANANRKHVVLKDFKDGFFPFDGAKIKAEFESLKSEPSPDLIFTHFRQDRHQDHRTISDLTWNTWRNHLILEYEIPKYDGDLAAPNVFVPVNPEVGERKAHYICSTFQTQGNKAWMTEDTFLSLLRIRGVECAAPQKYAEAFHARKLLCTFQAAGSTSDSMGVVKS